MPISRIRIRIRISVALAALLAAVALTLPASGGPLAPAAASARLLVGISDESPATFADPRFVWLHMPIGRLVVSWDVMRRPAELARADAWLGDARASGVEPLVVFDHNSVHPMLLPSLTGYGSFVRRFLRAHAWVHDYSAWNEEDHESEPTSRDPRRAAQYFNLLSAACPRCAVTAADVLDAPQMISWIHRFLPYAHHPRIWGVHNYYDLNSGGHRRTSELLNAVPGQIWFTETGGLVWRYDRTHHVFLVRGEAYAARAARRLFALAAISPRIKRIYYYHWRITRTLAYVRRHGKVSWDSGLMRPDCSLRPAFGVIARALGRNLRHMPRAKRDKAGDCVSLRAPFAPTAPGGPSGPSGPT